MSPSPRSVTPTWRPWAAALAASALILLAAQVVEHLERRTAVQRERADVQAKLSTLRARLEGVITANRLLVHGLNAVISAQPDLDQANFERIARGLVNEQHALRHIAAAPDLVVSLIYPRTGNEAALGLDYRIHPTQGPAAQRAITSRGGVVAGPAPLAQGGLGIIIREPVYVAAAAPGEPPHLWGLVSAVIDADALYRLAGLDQSIPGLHLSLRGTDASGPAGPVFFGDPQVYSQSPVTVDVNLPGGSWQLAAAPAAGWGHTDGARWSLRLGAALIALLSTAAILWRARWRLALARTAARLRTSQNWFDRAQQEAQHRLAESEARLRALLDAIPDLVWLKDPQGVYLACNPRFERLYGAPAEAILGRTDDAFVTAELADFFRENDRAAITADGPRSNEEWLTFADGHRELTETIKSPLYDTAGTLIGVLGIGRDITERKRAEEQIREGEARLVEAQRLAQLGNWELNLRSGQLHWSAEVYHIFDLDPEHFDASYDAFLNAIHPDDRAAVDAAYADSVARRTPYAITHRLRLTDGRVKTVEEHGQTFYQEDGTPLRSVGTVQDVTDLRQAEAEARRGEAVLESVFQSLPDLFFLMDTDGTIRDYRARTDGDLYLPPENFLGRRMQDVVPPTVGSLFEHHLAALGPNGDLASYEYDLAMPGGERRFEARLTRLPDSTQVIAIVRDVTARKHAEDALRETQQRFLEALENIPDVVVIYDRMLRIRYVNAATRNLTGRPVESFIGRGDEEIWPSPICETWLPTLRTARNTATIQTIEVDLDLPGTPPAGGPRCLAITCVPLLNEQGEVREVLGITHDLSRRKAAEQAIRRLNEALEERVRARTAELETANKELETFTYSVSHDLKAPLRGIDGYSRLLLDDHLHCLNDEGRLFLNNVRRGVAQMHDLINDLLAYSRMERRTLQPTVIDLEAQVQAVLTERAEEIAARDVEVLLDLNGLKVHADPDGLAMILRNLMDNALKFGRDRQPLRIGIHATAADDRVILRFEDNGIGFDSRFQERIFDIFQRLQRAEDYPGTGIGLAIVRKAAQRMGGRVWAEGTAGLGATFFVELPQ